MSNQIILKKSSVQGKAPVAGDLEYGELAINYNDGKLYYKTSTNTIASFSSSETGTVSSVAVTSTDLTISGSPITNSGTITLSLNTVPVNKGGTGQTSFSSGYIRSDGSALSSTATISASDISGIVSTASTVSNTGSSSSTATHYLTFVAANSTSAQGLNTTSGLSYKPSTGVLTANEFSVTQGTNGSAALITTTTATNQVVDSVSSSIYRTVKYVLQVSSGAAYQTSEILMIHDDTSAYLTEYATIKTTTNTLATFDATLSGGNLQLLVSPINALTTVRAVRTAINI